MTPNSVAGINTITSNFSTVLPWTLGDITLKTMNLVNNQIDPQFFMYVYFYSLCVSGSHVPIIRRIIVSMRHLVYVTMCRWPSGMQEHMLLHTRRSSKYTWNILRQVGYLQGSYQDGRSTKNKIRANTFKNRIAYGFGLWSRNQSTYTLCAKLDVISTEIVKTAALRMWHRAVC